MRRNDISVDAIPLIRARYVQAFANASEALGVRSAKLAEDLRIPEKVFCDPDALHPATQLFAFAGAAARATGRADLGLVAGRTKLKEHGAFGSQVAGSLTLHQALASFCAEALKEYSRAFFWIERRGSNTWFCRHRIDGEEDERRQVELYLVELMLQTIRLTAGPAWVPRTVWLQTDETTELRNADTLSQGDVRFGRPILAIPIPRRLLSRSVPRVQLSAASASGSVAEREMGVAPPAEDFVESLKQVIHTYLQSGQATIGTMAEVVGTSVRTLQRRLEGVGVVYSTLVDEVRLQTAAPLLEDPDILVTDIAFELGYSDPAHFTRAFRRWAGVSPSEYRADRLAE
jgi:AraC-like DNA-binding protein